MLAIAGQQDRWRVARNRPYGPEDGVTHTLRRHALPGGLLNVMLEVRNDLLRSEAQCAEMAEVLADWIASATRACAPQEAAS